MIPVNIKSQQDLMDALLVKRLKVGKVIDGKPSGMVLVMDFDSNEAITALFASDEYAALIPGRDKGFAEMNILLTHEM